MEERIKLVEEWNASLKADFHNGKISAEAALKGYERIPAKLSYPSLSWVRWWKSAWGWSMLTRAGEESSWLPFSHPDMVQSREHTMSLINEKHVHPYLILNYDQLWRNCWQMSRHKLCYKSRHGTGRRVGKTAADMRTDKKLHSVKGSRRSVTAPCQYSSSAG